MSRSDFHGPGQIGDGAGQLEDAVVSARGKLQAGHGGFHQAAAGIIQNAERANFRRAHIRVASDRAVREALALALAGRFHPRAYGRRGFPQARVAQFLVFHPRHLDMDVNAVEQRAGDAFLILSDHG